METTCHDGDKVFVKKCDSVDIVEIDIFVVNGDVYIMEPGSPKLIHTMKNTSPLFWHRTRAFIVAEELLGLLRNKKG